MLLPQTKEREYRFRLALRMGLPIFGLILALISTTIVDSYETLPPTFYFTSVILLAFSIYFIFYIIYKGFDVRITEPVSKTFTRDYLYDYLLKDIQKEKEYSLILISVDNLHDINTRYGIKNGDKVLFEVAKYIGEYLKDKKIDNFPMGHIKGGDFILGLNGKKENYNSILELFFLKSNDFKVDEIEVNISGAITDTLFSNDLNHLIENLFELQFENKNKKIVKNKNEINPNQLESYVIDAINSQSVIIMTQDIYENDNPKIKECFVKLKSSDGKILYPKSYMKVVNRLGLTIEYDLLVLQKSILNCETDLNTMISINISPTSIRNSNFLIKLKELLNDNPHLKNRIIFMLSEVEYYSHIQRYNATLQSLRRDGIKIAIDRLGSLHTSFLYLRELDIDIVRFDSSYTKDIDKLKYKSILNGFNNMAHVCGVKTWIKMVENQEIMDFIQSSDINYIQGKALSLLEKTYED